MIGWKQAYTVGYENIVLVKLEIPDDAKVGHINKYGYTKDIYFADKAKVLSITSFDGKHRVREAISMKVGSDFKYRVGEMSVAKKEPDAGNRTGIYFFATKEQALKYQF